MWNVWSWTTSLDVHCSRPHKRRRSSQQFKKLCACVSCLSSNCSFKVLAVRFDLIRFDLIAFLRRESHWSAQNPFYFLRWFLFFQCLGRRFCQQSPRPCRFFFFAGPSSHEGHPESHRAPTGPLLQLRRESDVPTKSQRKLSPRNTQQPPPPVAPCMRHGRLHELWRRNCF